MKRPTLYASLLLLAALLIAIPASTAEDAPKLDLELIAPDKAPTSGAHHSGYKAILHNKCDKPVTLVLPGDGSSVGWRTPHIRWSLAPVGKELQAHKPMGARCGNINGFRPTEIFVLEPGAKKDLGGWIGGVTFPAAGEFDLVLHYENDPERPMKGLQMRRPGAANPYDAVKETTAVNVTSSPVRLKVQPGVANGIIEAIE